MINFNVSRMLHVISTVFVILCWPVYLALFFGRTGPGTERQRQDSTSRLGILLQAASVGVTWAAARPVFTPLSVPFPLSIMAPPMAAILAAGAVWFSRTALRFLGRQWSLVAGLTADHRLIKDGPYAVVRHPLYTCFFALTFATAIVWSRPTAIPVIIVLFWAGVWIRVRSEEKILRSAFGVEFDEYVRDVGAFFPRLRHLL